MSKEFYEKIASLPPKRLVLLALDLHAESEALKRTRSEPIAIVGTSCRVPGGARTPEAFWRLLYEGVDAITEVPRERWDAEALYDPDPNKKGRTYARWGGFIDGVDRFDAAFFGVSPREASRMDPQQRLLLEVAWEALERAGQPPDQLAGSRTGVFLGIIGSDYAQLQARQLGEAPDIYHLTGTSLNAAAGRLSYTLGLQGPCMSIDTACSSSLVALHVACQSLRNRECDLALSAGVNLMLMPDATIALSSSRGLSPDGRCKTFDASANGFVRAEGCVVLVLKRLSDALANGDEILSLIAGSAVNQDGASSGLMVPNGPAQERVIEQALASGGLKPSQISFVEAHGTGTSLGDPIELQALARVLGTGRSAESPLFVGSVKTNVGHLEATAGLTGVLKAALSLRNEAIPPNLHFKRLNPDIVLDGAPVVVPTEPRPWPRAEQPRLAGVSAFGISGTNAHVILQEPPVPVPQPALPQRGAELLVLSARSPEALRAMAGSHARWFAEHPDVALREVCATAALSRAHHDHRLALAGLSSAEFVEKLGAFSRGEAVPGAATGRRSGQTRRRVVFVFPGQGSQWLGMGRKLLEEEPSFRAALERCDEAIRACADFSVLGELAAGEGRDRLHEIDVIQPVLFAMEVALAEMWRAWGIAPDAVVGHSMGEVAAAHVAGTLSLEDAARIICRRSRLLRGVSGQGSMLLVDLTMEEAKQALRGFEERVSVAVSNSVRSTVLSGAPAAIEEISNRLKQRDVFCRFVKVDVASHSPQMDPLREELLAALQGIAPRAARVPICSTVTGAVTDGASFGASYWADNLREPVLFSKAIERLAVEGHDIFIELSPHPILLPAVEQHLRHLGREGTVLPSLRRDEDERGSMLSSWGTLYAVGHEVDLQRQHPVRGRRVALPTYPWQHERFWVEAPTRARRTREAGHHPLLGTHVALAAQEGSHLWQTELFSDSPAYLGDHVVHGEVVLPGTAYLEMALAGAVEALGPARHALEDVIFQEMMVLPREESLPVQMSFVPDEKGAKRFRIFSHPAGGGGGWTLHAEGRIREGAKAEAFALEEARGRCTEHMDGEAHYQLMQERGVDFGPSFRLLKEMWKGSREAVARLELPSSVASEMAAHQLHPALLDACFQIINGAGLGERRGETFVPVAVENLRTHGRPGRELWGHARVRSGTSSGAGSVEADVTLLDGEGRVLMEARGLMCRRLDAVRRRSADEIDKWMYLVDWQEAPREDVAPSPASTPGAWLVLADRQGFGKKLQAALRERGEQCVVVSHGEESRLVEPGHYVVDPSRTEGFARILEAEFGSGRPACRGVVHLFSLDAPRPEEGLEALARARSLGAGSALHLTQALVASGFRDMPRVWLVTEGVQAVKSAERVAHVEQAPIWGMGRVLSLEHPEFRCCSVDLGALDEAQARVLVDELFSSTLEEQVALRGAARFVARLSRMERSKAAPAELRADGTYLITGGLGGLGLKLAEWLVARGARHIALLGRRGGSAEAAQAIDALRAAGAEVRVCKADVAVRADLERVFGELAAGMPPLRGVFHAAAVLDDGVLANLTSERLRTVMEPKIHGAWNLHELTAAAPLDFFVLFAAAGSLLGSPGQGNYAAANVFLDALASYRRGLGLPALSVDWGSWAGVGLAAAAESRGERIAQRGVDSMQPAQALEALGRVLEIPHARVVVMRFELRQWREFYLTAAQSPFLSRLAREQASSGGSPANRGAFVETLRAAERPKRAQLLEAHLCEQVGHVLRLAPSRIDPQQPLGSLGLDSLMGLEIRNRLEASLGLRLPATLVWRYPTVAALIEHLAEQLQLTITNKAEQPLDEAAALEAVIVNNVKQLSDEEAEALLAEKLAALAD
ncbi:myxalamid-type polyketide synthase MxaE and MxaD [Stigmatella aurantiaca]|uniref:Myxalamid-type polyketide synthase MxaE and MxaD n=1 Tax=Stigmatella aurantiaca TaxID=41 RepID=A0A1H7MSR7_STIAU|nr:type I polyketide synthase [Stigmatella aurantiaca]SEL14099.1 myxalamid-type polyketide synthase MxaE and MxaD [Stigmatella aurantiaca]